MTSAYLKTPVDILCFGELPVGRLLFCQPVELNS
jgi:hypothetical protein